MNKLDQKSRVKAVCAYLADIGSTVSTVQGYEVLARALGVKNKHVLASLTDEATVATLSLQNIPSSSPRVPSAVLIDGQSVKVFGLTEAEFGIAQMRALDWKFDVVVPMALDQLDDIETMNDYASKRITGDENALENIRYDHVPELNFGKGWVAYRVHGYVSSPEDFWDEEAEAAQATFYADLGDFCRALNNGTTLRMRYQSVWSTVAVGRVNVGLQTLLLEYARSQGTNNAEVNGQSSKVVVECRRKEGEQGPVPPLDFDVSSLKYVRKVDDGCWFMDVHGQPLTVKLLD